MRYRQLIENEMVSYTDVYHHLKKECSPFFEASKGFKYVPHREMALGYGTEEMTYLFRFKNRKFRRSVLQHVDHSARENIDIILKSKGFASRHEYMVSSSSLGDNRQYPVNEHSPVLFPIGNFDYSYIDHDFNMHTDGLKDGMTKDFLHFVVNSEELEKIGINKVFHSKETLFSFYSHLRSKELIIDVDDDINIIINDIFDIIGNVRKDDYVNAFDSENEIWFNCKEYFLLPIMDYEYMMEDING